VVVNGERDAGEGNLAIFERAGDGIAIKAKTDAKLLVMDGEPFDEPIVGHGPFVMNSRAEIQQALRTIRWGRWVRLDDADRLSQAPQWRLGPHAPISRYHHNRIGETAPTPTSNADHGPGSRRRHHQPQTRPRPRNKSSPANSTATAASASPLKSSVNDSSTSAPCAIMW
jgi:hypothetical protein